MKLRHAAALALVGWYLMVPPWRFVQTAHPIPDADAPLSKWITKGTFDSAVECNRYLMSILTSSNPADPAFQNKLRAQAARCIASDDPRLKGN